MKLLFDLSIVGAAAYPHQRGTFGMLRVAEHLTHGLLTDPEVEPWFWATYNRAAARRYFHERLAPQAAPRRAPVAGPKQPRRGVRAGPTPPGAGRWPAAPCAPRRCTLLTSIWLCSVATVASCGWSGINTAAKY